MAQGIPLHVSGAEIGTENGLPGTFGLPVFLTVLYKVHVRIHYWFDTHRLSITVYVLVVIVVWRQLQRKLLLTHSWYWCRRFLQIFKQ